MTIGRRIAPVSASTPFPPCTALVAKEVAKGWERSDAAAGRGMPTDCQDSTGGPDPAVISQAARSTRPRASRPAQPPGQAPPDAPTHLGWASHGESTIWNIMACYLTSNVRLLNTHSRVT